MEDSQSREIIDEIMDKLAEFPPEKIRKRFINRRHPENLDFEKTIGNTSYVVKSHFNKNSNEDMVHKIRRMILSDNNE
jgi:hypothetical protein